MWYKNIAGRFSGLVTKHACERRTDGQTDGQTHRITTPKLRRAVKCFLVLMEVKAAYIVLGDRL